jgi:hypothetical protein
VRDGQWKFVQAPAAELYDVRADPGERSNLFDGDATTAASWNESFTTSTNRLRRTARRQVLQWIP